jgi:hypothetical protein
MKYTYEVLLKAVQSNISVMGVLRSLGVSESSGGMHYHISRRIKQLEIDTSHFKGIRANSGVKHTGGKCREISEILVLKYSGRREKVSALRRALREAGRPEVCELCGLGPKWNNKPLVLQIDHKNGNNRDNRPENIRFICPNCHTQTSNYGQIKNKKPSRHCGCGAEISYRNKSGMCHRCVCTSRRK